MSDLDLVTLKATYLQRLQARIARYKHYPRQSRRRREEGRVSVGFSVLGDGSIEELVIVASSGVERLDRAALKTIRQAAPFEPLPQGLHRDRWTISAPLVFSLR